MILFFFRVHLHAVNGIVPVLHRAQYLWCSVLWLTTINGSSIVTKRNIVAEVISLMFVVLRDDVIKIGLTISEPIEHMLGTLWQMIREFAVL